MNLFVVTRVTSLDWLLLLGVGCGCRSHIPSTTGDAGSRLIFRTASFCAERSGHFDAFDQVCVCVCVCVCVRACVRAWRT